jgi:hypothetical protein
MLKIIENKSRLIPVILVLLIIINYMIVLLYYNKFLISFTAILYLIIVILFFITINCSLTFKFSLICIGIISAGHTPIDWDAWAIWLFHGNRIFIEENLFSVLDNYANIHNSYPMIAPSFMASYASLIGGWNTILPKFSIFLLYLPPFLYANYFFGKKFNVLFLLITIFTFQSLLYNGYLDGLVATYFGFSTVIYYKIFFKKEEIEILDFTILLSFLIVLSLMKNEGFVLTVIILSTLFYRIKNFKKKYFLLFLTLIPYITWKFITIKYGLKTDLFEDLNIVRFETFKELISSIILILKFLLFNEKFLISFFLFGFFFLKAHDRTIFYIGGYCSTVYLLVLIFVYLISPHDLNWHLQTSGVRVSSSIYYLLILCTLTFLTDNKNKIN